MQKQKCGCKFLAICPKKAKHNCKKTKVKPEFRQTTEENCQKIWLNNGFWQN